MPIVAKTAKSFANRKFRGTDEQFVDECTAEAYFWLVLLFHEYKEEMDKQEDKVLFMRMKIGYKLREYWAPYAMSTLTYLKKTNQHIPKSSTLDEESLSKVETSYEEFELLQSVIKDDTEWAVYEQFIIGKKVREIATGLQLRPKRVAKILARIKKRLKKAASE